MEYTKEQIDIIESTGNIKVNAVAGSGKTSVLIGYAQARQDSKILYVAFNKTVKLEAIKKFKENNLVNVQVETAHSLAYANIVRKHRYKVKNSSYKISEITELLKLEGDSDKHTKFIVANHINKLITYYCNSVAQNLEELDYLETVTDPIAKDFVKTYYKYIQTQTKLILDKMDKGKIEVIHDFYLKKFQLSNPVLDFDYILFDEGQDASGAMLDVFSKQKATKVIVGDTNQQIYSWRFAVNSMDKSDFKTYNLSTSFRFSQDIADLAMRVLDMKIGTGVEYKKMQITGKGTNKKFKGDIRKPQTQAVIGRTNLGLLLKAIEYIDGLNTIYFEGSIYSYTYADEGTSLYDVLNLYKQKYEYIKDNVIKGMSDIDELKEYVKKTGDVQLKTMVDIVLKYKSRIPYLLKELKEKHVENKEDAEMIFSTVHRCKGMEYDEIELCNDFITQEDVDAKEKSNIAEEINLLYVAITRTKNRIDIPYDIMPENFKESTKINVI